MSSNNSSVKRPKSRTALDLENFNDGNCKWHRAFSYDTRPSNQSKQFYQQGGCYHMRPFSRYSKKSTLKWEKISLEGIANNEFVCINTDYRFFGKSCCILPSTSGKRASSKWRCGWHCGQGTLGSLVQEYSTYCRNSLTIPVLSCAVYPHNTELSTSTASLRFR